MLRSLLLSAVLALGLGLAVSTADACPMQDATTASAGEMPKNSPVVRYTVEGMTCGSCALKIREVVEGVKGVKIARVHMDGTMEVAFDDKVTTADAILAAALKAGEYTIKKV